MSTYHIETDKGTYEVEVADDQKQPQPVDMNAGLNGVASGVNKTMQFINNPGGASPGVPLTPGGQDLFNKLGGNVAEYLGKKQVNPYLAAGVGTAVSMANPQNWISPPMEAGMPGRAALQDSAQEAGVKTLGFTKRFLNKPGAFDKAKGVAQTMLDEGVITNPITHPLSSGTADMLDRAQTLGDTSGQKIGNAISDVSASGKNAFSGTDVANEIKSQLSPKFTGGAYDAEHAAVNEIVDTVKAHGDGPISFDSAQALKEKLQELGKFNSNTDGVKANLYRRASGIVRDALDKSASDAGISPDYFTNKKIYGASQQAEKALTNRFSSEQGNKNVGLTDTIAAGAELAAGNPGKALVLVGAKKALERYYHATKATGANYLANAPISPATKQAALAAFISKVTTKDNQ